MEEASAIPVPAAAGRRPTRHRLFSPLRVLTIAGGTFTQLVRMKVFAFMAIFAAVIIAVSFGAADLNTDGQLKLLKDVSLAAMSLFSMLFAVAGTALLLPRDIEDRTLYTILCKPVPRFEYLLGKLGGVGFLILVSLLLMDILFCGVLYWKEQAVLRDQLAILANRTDLSPEAMRSGVETMTRLVEDQGLRWGIQAAVVAIFLKSLVLTAVTLMVSTFASSTIFTIMASLAVMIIGQAQSMARDVLLGPDASLVPRLVAGGVALVFPDFKGFDIIDAVVTGTAVPGIVLAKMAGLTAVYLTIHMTAAYVLFSDKEL